jgi:hypothetical protein
MPLLVYDAGCDRADRGDEMFTGVTLLGLVLVTGGVLTTLTGLIGFCPACAMAGRKSLEGPL